MQVENNRYPPYTVPTCKGPTCDGNAPKFEVIYLLSPRLFERLVDQSIIDAAAGFGVNKPAKFRRVQDLILKPTSGPGQTTPAPENLIKLFNNESNADGVSRELGFLSETFLMNVTYLKRGDSFQEITKAIDRGVTMLREAGVSHEEADVLLQYLMKGSRKRMTEAVQDISSFFSGQEGLPASYDIWNCYTEYFELAGRFILPQVLKTNALKRSQKWPPMSYISYGRYSPE